MPTKNINGYYWKEMDCYLCRFTDNPDKLLCNGAIELTGHNYKPDTHYVWSNAQYIPSEYITDFKLTTSCKQ